MRARTGIALFLLIALVSPPTFAAQQRVSQRGDVASDVTVEISNVAGSVRVTAWDRNEIEVSGTLGEGVSGLAFENDSDGVEIKVEVPRSRRRDPERRVGDSHLEISVPRGATVEIDTLVASISVDGVAGGVRMESSAGSIVYAGDSLSIEADTAAGDIEINSTAVGAEIDVEGVAGSVSVQFVAADVSAGALTGDLRILGGRLSDGDFESVSGLLYFEAQIDEGADVRFENFNGDVELLIPADTSADFDISSYSGSIETEFGFEGRSVERYTPEQVAEFTLGSGAADVEIETFAGNVKIRKQ